MTFSIIVPTCNRNDLLAQCLEELFIAINETNIYNVEVIVTDDSKSQHAKSLIEKSFPWVKWIEGPKKGPAANRNNGARFSSGEWLIFLDDDCLPNKNLLYEYNTAALIHNDIKVFEGCIKADREKKRFMEESPINESGGYLWSCNFMIDRVLFQNTLHGFDEDFLYPAMEDRDLHYRLIKFGVNILFLPKAFVIHPWRLQTNIISITKKRFKSTLVFLKKHPEKANDINSLYFLKVFAIMVLKNIFVNSTKYQFRGIIPQLKFGGMQLYFSLYLLLKRILVRSQF